jgi:cupin superfamily acireductone dioxygenase involved in methionine salvage
MRKRSIQSARQFEITSSADRHTLEALQLEIRRLAREHGYEVTDVRITDVEDDEPGGMT